MTVAEDRLRQVEADVAQLRNGMRSRLLDVEIEIERVKGVQYTKLARLIEFVRHASQDPSMESAEQKFYRLQERAKALLETS